MAPKKPVETKKKGLGKGLKVFLVFMTLMVVAVLATLAIKNVNERMILSRTVMVEPDLEFGGEGDGEGRFHEPWALALDPEGNLLVSDFNNHRIQKFSPEGKFLSAFGKRTDDKEKVRKTGTFNQPTGVYVDPSGNLYVCDTFNHRIQKFDRKGKFLSQWTDKSFFGPKGIAGGSGRIFISDTGNHQVQVFDLGGHLLTRLGGKGDQDGKLEEPVGVVTDPQGNLFVADTENRRIQKFDPSGKLLGVFKIQTWKGKSSEMPYLAFGGGALYASNASENAVLKLDPASGKILAIYKKKGDKNGFVYASGVAVDGAGRVYVTEKSVNRIIRFTPPPSNP